MLASPTQITWPSTPTSPGERIRDRIKGQSVMQAVILAAGIASTRNPDRVPDKMHDRHAWQDAARAQPRRDRTDRDQMRGAGHRFRRQGRCSSSAMNTAVSPSPTWSTSTTRARITSTRCLSGTGRARRRRHRPARERPRVRGASILDGSDPSSAPPTWRSSTGLPTLDGRHRSSRSRRDDAIQQFVGRSWGTSRRGWAYKTVNIYKFSRDFLQRTYIPFLEAYVRAR